ncbi:hypothetical protein PGT21_003362 [Puccinia graminis f. sp. tritici]|uniref:ATP-dependent DNA helicase sgs1 n=1 Tax=Puccinia graminis f. sp. tritici TaxID=56615 RepID=A0A5B0MSZ2_PUCGR|nr:hypothetical protein PGT21_003362 [Puccinia graminis f. sp. tritici]
MMKERMMIKLLIRLVASPSVGTEADKEAKAEKRKQELKRIGAGCKKDSETGNMIIDEKELTKDGNDESTNALLEAVHGADGFRRDARGNVKANKKRKLDPDVVNRLEQDEEQQLNIQDAVHILQITDDKKKLALLIKRKRPNESKRDCDPNSKLQFVQRHHFSLLFLLCH